MTGPSALAVLGADVEWTDSVAATAARRRVPAGSGRLAELAEWLAATCRTASSASAFRARAVIFSDTSGASEGPDPALADVAHRHDVAVRVVSPPARAAAAFEAGAALADEEVDSGTDLLVLGGAADAGSGAAVAALILGAEPVALLPRGSAAVDTYAWVGRATRLRDDRRRIAALRSEPDAMLDALGCAGLAMATALLMRAVARRTPVILDGVLAMTAALVCYDTQPRAGRWWRVADTGDDPIHQRILAEFVQTPVLGLGLTRADGLAGVVTVAVLRAAAELVAPHALSAPGTP